MMKNFATYLLVLFVYSANLLAQITDENTSAINQYFTNIQENPVVYNEKNNDQNNSLSFQLQQTGANNLIHVNYLRLGDKQVVKQIGNKNTYQYYTYYNVDFSNISISQTGNSNSIQIFGENSLIKNATISQKSNFQELIIKNYSNSF